MKAPLLITALFLFAHAAFSQKASLPAEKIFTLSGGQSFASSGDIDGFYVNVGFQKIKKRWNYSLGLTTNIHDSYVGIYYQQSPNSEYIDGSIKNTIAGLQLEGIVALSIVKNDKHNLNFGLGAIARYQSSSDNDSYQIMPHTSSGGVTTLVVAFYNHEPQRTFAVGPIAKLAYQYTINRNWVVGISGSLQLDTNGDNFINRGLTVGYKL